LSTFIRFEKVRERFHKKKVYNQSQALSNFLKPNKVWFLNKVIIVLSIKFYLVTVIPYAHCTHCTSDDCTLAKKSVCRVLQLLPVLQGALGVAFHPRVLCEVEIRSDDGQLVRFWRFCF
jgi:hypothetical protein